MNRDLFIFISVSLVIVLCGALAMYHIWQAHKIRMIELKKRQAEKDLCRCGHERWYHSMSSTNNYIRCFEFAGKQESLQLCKCLGGFKLDNLKYLEEQYAKRSNADNHRV